MVNPTRVFNETGCEARNSLGGDTLSSFVVDADYGSAGLKGLSPRDPGLFGTVKAEAIRIADIQGISPFGRPRQYDSSAFGVGFDHGCLGR